MRASAVRVLSALIVCASALLAACGDSLGVQTWDATPDTVTLYAGNRAELANLPSAFDFINGRAVIVESAVAQGAWDVVLLQQGTGFTLAPAGAIVAPNPRAALSRVTATSLEAVTSAPSDTTAYQQIVPVGVQPGDVFVIRTRRATCSIGSGFRYGKLQIVAADTARGTLRFAYTVNPYCDNRDLIPPKG